MKFETLKIRIKRRKERLSRTERIMNIEVLGRVGEEREAKARQNKLAGHMVGPCLRTMLDTDAHADLGYVSAFARHLF